MINVKRYYLELKNFDLGSKLNIPNNLTITQDESSNFEINKFFYKQVGIDHYWRDRLIWSDKEWNKYVQNRYLETWVMRQARDMIGFYEMEFHSKANEIELINMGILKEYRGKKLGSNLLKHFINTASQKKVKRSWVHTCSLDHKHALYNYKSRGFKIFKEEEVSFIA